MQGRFKRDSGAAGDPEQQSGTAGSGQGQAAGDSGGATPGPTAATGRTSTPSGIDAGRITGLDGKPGPRIAMRNWRISTRLVSLLALPVVTAGALGGLRINNSLDNIHQLERMKTLTDITEHAVDLADALQEERDTSAGPITAGHPDDDAITAARQATDREKKAYIAAGDVVESNAVFRDNGVRSSLIAIDTQLTSLAGLRTDAFTSSSSIAQTVSSYDGLIQSLLGLTQDMGQATNNPQMIKATRALQAFASAKEYESIQRAVISAALAGTGKLSANDYQSVKWGALDEEAATTRFITIYGTPSAVLLKPIQGGNDTISQHDNLRDRIAATPDALAGVKLSYLDWDDAAKTKIQAMNQVERSLLSEMQQKSLKLQKEAKQQALIDGALILLVLGVAVVGAFVVARSMIRSLRRLQQTANDVAQKRLPELVKQLSETDPQDVDTSVESIGINSRDEIGQVARAFDEVHSEAVRLAAEQALLRGNVNAMFTNLSRRSQGLIQRQLSLISELESREADPDQLSSLFKLDHLATRMRRNGENLLVLAGEEPGRRWTRPVPLVDVLRAAASEVEQYERIELTSVPSAEVTGRIVNDLVHLLAELLENATSFSSPQTKVRVTGHALPDGRVLIEIHDTGIGLSPEDLADINERLANPPTVDVSVSRRMGLFVVGRLSLRHGIRIQLRPSDSGGTTALVMLPVDLTQGGGANKNVGTAGRPGTTPPAPSTAGIAGAFGGTSQVARQPQRNQVGGGAQRPALAPGGRPGGNAPQQPGGPRWAAQDGPQGFPDDRGAQDTPRGHEDVEAAPAFDAFEGPAPAGGPGSRAEFPQGPGVGDPFGRQQGPGQGAGPGRAPGGQPGQGGRQPGQFPPPQPQNTGPSGFRSDVFGGRPGPSPRRGEPGGPADSGQFPAVRQGGPGDTGQFPAVRQGGPGETAEFPAVRDDFGPQGDNSTGQQAIPGQPGQGGGLPQRGGRGRSPQETYGTGQFAAPGQNDPGAGRFPARRPDGAGTSGQYPIPGRNDSGTGQFPAHQPGDTGQFPAQRPQGPGDTGQFPAVRPQGPGDTGQFPAARPQGPGDTGQFPAVRPQGPGDTGQFPAQRPGGPGRAGQLPPRRPDGSGDTGQFPAPRLPQDDSGQFPAQRPGDTGQFPAHQPGDTGQFPAQRPQGPGHTGQFPAVRAEGPDELGAPGAPGQGDGGQYGGPVRPTGTGQYPAGPGGLPQRGARGPQGGPGFVRNGRPGAPQESHDTGQHALPGQGGPGAGQYPVAPQQQPQNRPDPLTAPMALPPAPTRGDEPTPIFAAIESDWFRTGQAERMQQIHVEQSGRGQQAPPPRPVGRTAPPQRPRTDQRPAPQRPGTSSPQHAPASAASPAAAAPAAAQTPAQQAPSQPQPQPLPRETPNWRTSPNDALRQRAEQVREPSAGGVTPSGLPRRVPRANLVPGGAAQQQAPAGGPQVSRSPDDVRGRLTNLRRGIQQGRQAGGGNTDGRGFGTNHQER